MHKYKICHKICLQSIEKFAECSCNHVTWQTTFNVGISNLQDSWRSFLCPKYFICSSCFGARSPSEEEEASDVRRAAWIYKVGYKLLVTQCAIAVCTDLISLFTYPDFALSPNQLPVPYVSWVFVSVLLTQREQTIQSASGVCRTACARLTLMLPGVRLWKSELPFHFCLFLDGKSLVLGYRAFRLSLLLKECLFFHDF